MIPELVANPVPLMVTTVPVGPVVGVSDNVNVVAEAVLEGVLVPTELIADTL